MIRRILPSQLPDRWLLLVVGKEEDVLRIYAGHIIYNHKRQYWVEV